MYDIHIEIFHFADWIQAPNPKIFTKIEGQIQIIFNRIITIEQFTLISSYRYITLKS